MVSAKCRFCGVYFFTQPARIAKGNGKYCSKSCSGKASVLGKNKEKCNSWKGGITKTKSGYVQVLCRNHPKANQRGYIFEHILVAEKNLGKYLPDGAVVHHVNENPSDNSPENLVICESNSYHHGLHRRSRAYIATGNPNAIKCKFCKTYDIAENMHMSPRGYGYHRECNTKYYKERRVVNE
jgi:hypothetical protein